MAYRAQAGNEKRRPPSDLAKSFREGLAALDSGISVREAKPARRSARWRLGPPRIGMDCAPVKATDEIGVRSAPVLLLKALLVTIAGAPELVAPILALWEQGRSTRI